MNLKHLFQALADVFDGPAAIESHAREALLLADPHAPDPENITALAQPFLDIMSRADAHPVCSVIAQTPLHWAPPQTSDDPRYIAHSLPKVHVELLGPDGLVHSDKVRLGLYGMLADFEYGIRTHPAEEVFIMLAGQAWWKRGSQPYIRLGPGERSYHPSMMAHASKTRAMAFLSVYVWHGDISTGNYIYDGIPSA